MEKKIVLRNEIYDKGCILQAIEDFKEEAKVKITDDLFTLTLTSSHENIEREFANYVLGIMKNNGIA